MTQSIREERLYELLADKALVGVSSSELEELTDLLREFPNLNEASFERAAAATAIAALERIDQMPPHLAQRVFHEAESSVPTMARQPLTEEHTIAMPGRPVAPPPPQPQLPPMHMQQPMQPRIAPVIPFVHAQPQAKRPVRWPMIVSWIAAAACLLLAIGAWRYRPTVAAVPPAKERDQLIAKQGTTQVPWSATADPASKAASGDVVWNAREQRGYMRFRGLARNDPKVTQYQLWIFDKTRDDTYPVDGGVFDVDKDTGDVVVPIRAKITVNEATLFAVTVERPGGVVVSKRERIVVTAKLGS